MDSIIVTDNIKFNNTIVTIGKFDGVHKGHEKLFKTLEEKSNGRKKAVLAFSAPPKDFLNEKKTKTIMTDVEKELLCEKQGIDIYCQMPMTKEFLGVRPEEFIEKILIDKLGATAIVCGPDFRFGKEAKGNVEFLATNQEKYGYELYVVEKEKYQNLDISSTAIREKIAEGKIEQVNEMLDHPYSVIGQVEEGRKIGRTIDFPTVNLLPESDKLLPPNGVYVTKVLYDNKEYDAITNVGVNPTVSSGNPTKVESHMVDFNKDIYGKIIEVQFFRFVRPERKFNSVEELKEQINKDILEIGK